VGPPWGHKPCQQTCSDVGFSLHGSAGPGRSLLQHVPMGSQLPSGIHLLQLGSLPRAAGGYVLHRGPPWTAGGHPASPWSCLMSCKGRVSALASRAPPPPSFFTDLGVCRVVSLTSSHSSLSTAVSLKYFLRHLKYVIPEALLPSLIGLALASGGSILEPAGTGFIRYGGSFSQLLTEATPIAPPLPKPCHANP